jgi:hypothetical protein
MTNRPTQLSITANGLIPGQWTGQSVMNSVTQRSAPGVMWRAKALSRHTDFVIEALRRTMTEAFCTSKGKRNARLDGMITEPTLPIERKGFDLVLVPNYLHVLMLAEPGWVIPAGRYERRYAATSDQSLQRLHSVQ